MDITKNHSTAIIKWGFYMGSRSNVTPLLGDGNLINIGRNEFIQMDGIPMHNTNPFDFTIKEGMHVCIYYENLFGMSEEK